METTNGMDMKRYVNDAANALLPLASFFDLLSVIPPSSLSPPLSITMLSAAPLPGLPPIPDVLTLPPESRLSPVALPPLPKGAQEGR